MKYSGDFKDYRSMIDQWSGADAITDDEVICADYDCLPYEGYAKCFFVRGGKLFEVHDSHCSCCGLKQWEPEETSFEAVLMRTDLSENERALIEAAQKVTNAAS